MNQLFNQKLQNLLVCMEFVLFVKANIAIWFLGAAMLCFSVVPFFWIACLSGMVVFWVFIFVGLSCQWFVIKPKKEGILISFEVSGHEYAYLLTKKAFLSKIIFKEQEKCTMN